MRRRNCTAASIISGDAIALGLRLPVLENLGLRAISETTHVLSPGHRRRRAPAVIHDVLLLAPRGCCRPKRSNSTRT